MLYTRVGCCTLLRNVACSRHYPLHTLNFTGSLNSVHLVWCCSQQNCSRRYPIFFQVLLSIDAAFVVKATNNVFGLLGSTAFYVLLCRTVRVAVSLGLCLKCLSLDDVNWCSVGLAVVELGVLGVACYFNLIAGWLTLLVLAAALLFSFFIFLYSWAFGRCKRGRVCRISQSFRRPVYACACMCMHVYACVRVCMCVHVRECVHVCLFGGCG
jgi:hypothetical protein